MIAFDRINKNITQGTGVFPGSKSANIKFDFFFESEHEKRIPNQFIGDVLSDATC